MSGMFTIKVNMGSVISNAIRDIDKYDAEKQKKIRKVIADGTKAVRDRAVQAAPKGPTGKLRKGIKKVRWWGMAGKALSPPRLPIPPWWNMARTTG